MRFSGAGVTAAVGAGAGGREEEGPGGAAPLARGLGHGHAPGRSRTLPGAPSGTDPEASVAQLSGQPPGAVWRLQADAGGGAPCRGAGQVATRGMNPVALTVRREKRPAPAPTHSPALPPPGPALGACESGGLARPGPRGSTSSVRNFCVMVALPSMSPFRLWGLLASLPSLMQLSGPVPDAVPGKDLTDEESEAPRSPTACPSPGACPLLPLSPPPLFTRRLFIACCHGQVWARCAPGVHLVLGIPKMAEAFLGLSSAGSSLGDKQVYPQADSDTWMVAPSRRVG